MAARLKPCPSRSLEQCFENKASRTDLRKPGIPDFEKRGFLRLLAILETADFGTILD
jgi:hypothetical protein